MKSQLSFYFDEDVSVKIASNLVTRGFDALTTVEARNRGTSDEDQLAFAARHKRVLVTHNIKHFLHLHSHYIAQNKSHAGIILAVRHENPYKLVARLLNLLHHCQPDDMADQVRYL